MALEIFYVSPLVGFQRIRFRSMFQRVFRASLAHEWLRGLGFRVEDLGFRV